jgi:hypothetical protein
MFRRPQENKCGEKPDAHNIEWKKKWGSKSPLFECSFNVSFGGRSFTTFYFLTFVVRAEAGGGVAGGVAEQPVGAVVHRAALKTLKK